VEREGVADALEAELVLGAHEVEGADEGECGGLD
jgi:hypothetical protein